MTSTSSVASVSDLKPFLFGGIASCVAEAATFPIDTAKTRLQLQGNKWASRGPFISRQS